MKNRTCLQRAATAFLVGALLCGSGHASAQQPDEQAPRVGGIMGGMSRIVGEITAVNGTTLTVKTEQGGTVQVVTTDNTRVMKGRGVTVKVADLKPGDGITAAGNLAPAPTETLHAAFVFAMDAADVKKLKDNLGKTYITGRVTAIDLDNAKMTVERPDHISQTIGFDETTSFKRGRGIRSNGMGFGGGAGTMGSGNGQRPPADEGESITLADVKVGDNVAGQGSMKNGIFVPTQLLVATPGERRRNGAAGATGGAPAAGSGPGTN